MHPRPTSACWYKSTHSSAGVSICTFVPVKQVNRADTLTLLQLAARTRVARQYSHVRTGNASKPTIVVLVKASKLSCKASKLRCKANKLPTTCFCRHPRRLSTTAAKSQTHCTFVLVKLVKLLSCPAKQVKKKNDLLPPPPAAPIDDSSEEPNAKALPILEAAEASAASYTNASAKALWCSIRQHAAAYVSIRQHAAAYASIRQHTSACGSIRQHAAAYVRVTELELRS